MVVRKSAISNTSTSVLTDHQIIEGAMPMVVSVPVYIMLLTFPETSTALSDRGETRKLQEGIQADSQRTSYCSQSIRQRCLTTDRRDLELASICTGDD